MRFLKFVPFVCLCLSSFAFSSGFCDENSQKILIDVLASRYMYSGIANISPGEVVRAHMLRVGDPDVDYNMRGGTFGHTGSYIDAEVLTKVCTDIEPVRPEGEAGIQIVLLYYNLDESGCADYEESKSTNWTVTEVDGAKYIVHDHAKFLVYSNETDQFVVGK